MTPEQLVAQSYTRGDVLIVKVRRSGRQRAMTMKVVQVCPDGIVGRTSDGNIWGATAESIVGRVIERVAA